MSLNEICMELPSDHMTNVFGQFDHYMKIIERNLQVTVVCRNEQVKILGDANRISSAKQVISQLLELSRRGSTVTEQNVDYAIALVNEHLCIQIFSDIKYIIVNLSLRIRVCQPNQTFQIILADVIPEHSLICFHAADHQAASSIVMAVIILINRAV